MEYHKVGMITRQNIYSGINRSEVVIRGTNLLGSGTSIKSVTLAGVLSNVILSNRYEIFLYAGLGTKGTKGDICIENNLGEIIRGGTWTYE
jgi:hypothetical protein